MKIKREINRKKIFLYYAIAIVLPSFLLGILAFRGVKNDQALVERELRRKFLETGQQVSQKLEASLLNIENRFNQLTIPETLPHQKIFNDSILIQFCIIFHVVSGIFCFENNNLYLLNNELLYFPDGYFSENRVPSPMVFKPINEGVQFEFNSKAYDKAFQSYFGQLRTTNQNQDRGELLNAMARVAKKQGNFVSALTIYDSIQNNYSYISIQNKIPLGIVAYLEKSNCYLQLTDTVSALENSVWLLRMLSYRNWELEKSYYLDFLSKTNKLISESANSKNSQIVSLCRKGDSIKNDLSIQQQKTDYLLAFLKNGETVLKNSLNTSSANNIWQRCFIDGRLYFFSFRIDDKNLNRGLIFDNLKVLEDIIIPDLKTLASTQNFSWKVTDENDKSLAGSEFIPENILPVVSALPLGLQSWTLKIYPQNPGVLTTFIHSGGGLFFYIFLVVIIILVFGLVFTLQTINSEIHLSKMKSSFVSTVSHEFKSPLTSIRQMAEMLINKRVPTEEKKEKYYETILQQCERQSHLIENLLDFSKMEAGQKKFRFEKTDLVALANKVTCAFQDQMKNPTFQINVTSPQIAEINGDKESLELMLYNLIDNAYKYSGGSKRADIKIDSDNKQVELAVSDYGIGIDKKELRKIFNRFYRVGDELTRVVKGTGIGLTLVKEIVKAHNGTITVESTPGKGSTFRIKFYANGGKIV